MGILGWAVVAVAAVAAFGGYRTGLISGLLSWAGLAAGLYLAARYLPRAVSALSLSSPTARLVVAVALLVVAAFVGQAVGGLLGSRLHRLLPGSPLCATDRFAGAAAGLAAVGCAFWLLLPSIASVPGWPAAAVRHSSLAHWVSASLPAPPDALEALRGVVAAGGLHRELSSLGIAGADGPPPSSSPLSTSTLAAAEHSTVRVEGQACDRELDGSGFAVAPGLVLTNAHVVAGEPPGSTSVLEPDGQVLGAQVVLYNSRRDLALLRVPGLAEAPLSLGQARTGSMGDVLGHPGGAVGITTSPYRVARRIEAVGTGLYGRHRTLRQVFVLSASLAPGDSGGPLVDEQGDVVGVAFAIAVGHPDTAYALTSGEIRPDLVGQHRHRVGTGACLG